jgi:mono/diheme cytochrome c family protein
MRIPKGAFVFLFVVAFVFSGCHKSGGTTPILTTSYDTEADWSDSQKTVLLGFQEAQGKRVFYQYCVWCHADASPAGPSNRSNLTPVPPVLNDGSVLNGQSDEYLQNIIALGGSAMGKSPMMPPYGQTLKPEEIRSVIAFVRAISQPAYQAPARPGSQYSPK